jgi:hypothetical protein
VRVSVLWAVAVATAFVLFPGLAFAQQPGSKRPVAGQPVQSESARQQALREDLNQNTVTVISGNPNAAYLYLA